MFDYSKFASTAEIPHMDINIVVDEDGNFRVLEDPKPAYRYTRTNFPMRYPVPVKVIFNNPATIVFWADGTKTVVKCNPDDTFNKYHGAMAALLKKMLGNTGGYNKVIKKMLDISKDWDDDAK